MLTVYSDAHQLRDSKTELYGGYLGSRTCGSQQAPHCQWHGRSCVFYSTSISWGTG